jgi:hypothetical protein
MPAALAMSMDDFDEPTRRMPGETIAQLMATIGGHAQEPAPRHENFYTEMAQTQVLPAIETNEPNPRSDQ